MSGIASGSGGGGSFTGGSVASPILFPNGSASDPSMSFTSDTDTGFYRINVNEIGFTSGGTLVYRSTGTGFSAPVAASAHGNSLTIIATDGNGTDKNGGSLNFKLGNKTGTGTAGSFAVQDASSTNLFKVGYNGTVTGPTGADWIFNADSSRNIFISTTDAIIRFSTGYLGGQFTFGQRSLGLIPGGSIRFDYDQFGTSENALGRTSSSTLGLFSYAQAYVSGTGTAPTLGVYNKIDGNLDAGNYERFAVRWDSDVCYLETAKGGSGTVRPLVISGVGTTATISGGSASPEGAITAGPGSIYLRTGGGAGTGFYVKESGTGNTGWVAK